MRTWTVVAPSIAAVAAFAYLVFSSESLPTRIDATTAVVESSVNDLRASLVDVLEELRGYRQDSHNQYGTSMEGQAKLNDNLKRLSRRIDVLEKATERNAVHAAVSADELPSAAPEDAEVNAIGQTTDAMVTESDLGSWMNQSLGLGNVDDQVTSLAAEQASMTVAKKLVNVSLDDIQCEDRFCRAMFSAFDGGTPEISDVFGEPPFMTEGFTLTEPDGRVALYFTQPGLSVADLKREVKGY